jgi:vanillate O-demethylase ferredoxin subunit
MQPLWVKVTSKTIEAEGIASFELCAASGHSLPSFSAGSHIDVHVKPGLIRQYSLCNHPDENRRYLITVLRDAQSRGGSSAMHDEVQQGDLVQISEPRNHFQLVRSERTLLFAGGIGVTPLLCMAERLAQTGADFEMHYCTRSPSHTAFCQRIAASPFSDKVHFHFDNGEASQKLNLVALLRNTPQTTHAYVCGPAGFIKWVTETAHVHGWSDERVHTEYFTQAAADTSGDRSFDVRISSTGQTISIPPDQPVTVALAKTGIEIPVSCEQGVCGTCLTRILEGEPEHRDLYLTDEEKAQNNQFTPCCSRARSSLLVLDL